MIRILHTSDWHIGKQLKKVDFYEDMELFFEWLLTTIENEEIDVLLMSGDLFDLANPSQTAMQQYYGFLRRMIDLPRKCKCILTGGNHDSALLLNAPKQLLQLLDISIVGGMPEQLSDVFIPMNINGQDLVVAAVPYLRDRDIRKSVAGESYDEKTSQLRAGLKAYFDEVNTHYKEHFKDIPFIIMAHLFASGASVTDSERDIQIGNQAGIDSTVFGNEATYVALGHIHRPQRIGSDFIRYSGSPLPFSFSERKDEKSVVILTLENNELKTTIKPIPSFRKLVHVKGSLQEVKKVLENYATNSPQKDLLEVQIMEPTYSVTVIQEVANLRSQYENSPFEIVSEKVLFENQVKETGTLLQKGDQIGNYSPLELFQKRLDQDEVLKNDERLIHAFQQLIEEIHQEQQDKN